MVQSSPFRRALWSSCRVGSRADRGIKRRQKSIWRKTQAGWRTSRSEAPIGSEWCSEERWRREEGERTAVSTKHQLGHVEHNLRQQCSAAPQKWERCMGNDVIQHTRLSKPVVKQHSSKSRNVHLHRTTVGMLLFNININIIIKVERVTLKMYSGAISNTSFKKNYQ